MHVIFFILGERGYTYPYELAVRGEPGIDGKYFVFKILSTKSMQM